jgi:hypothetical protein
MTLCNSVNMGNHAINNTIAARNTFAAPGIPFQRSTSAYQ